MLNNDSKLVGFAKGKVVLFPQSKAAFVRFLAWCDKQGYVWVDGIPASFLTEFYSLLVEHDHCVSYNHQGSGILQHASRKHCKRNGYKVKKFDVKDVPEMFPLNG